MSTLILLIKTWDDRGVYTHQIRACFSDGEPRIVTVDEANALIKQCKKDRNYKFRFLNYTTVPPIIYTLPDYGIQICKTIIQLFKWYGLFEDDYLPSYMGREVSLLLAYSNVARKLVKPNNIFAIILASIKYILVGGYADHILKNREYGGKPGWYKLD